MLDSKNVHALIELIDDPDEQVYQHVKTQLKNVGSDVIPLMEESWENRDFGLLFQHRIQQLIHEIQFELCKSKLISWKQSSDKNLLEGAIIVASFQYPNLNKEKIITFIDKIKKDIWLEINPKQTAFEKIKIFNQVFYDIYGFRGDIENYNLPENSNIHSVIERKKGNPLSLSILYSIIAQELNVPVYGVNLPNHFVLCYMDENGVNFLLNEENKFGVLFYINTYAKGSIFYENDIHQFLQQLRVYPERSHFEPCSNSIIIQRMLTNLISGYQQDAHFEKIEELNELRSIVENY